MMSAETISKRYSLEARGYNWDVWQKIKKDVWQKKIFAGKMNRKQKKNNMLSRTIESHIALAMNKLIIKMKNICMDCFDLFFLCSC